MLRKFAFGAAAAALVVAFYVVGCSDPLDDKDTYAMYTLTTGVDSLGGGTVEREPNAEKYQNGTKVKLTAVAEDAHMFAGWSDNVGSAEKTVTVTVTGDMTVIARFRQFYTLDTEITPTGGGTVERRPYESATYSHGTAVTLKAVAAAGYKFVNWSGGMSSEEDTITVIMNNSVKMTANFMRACMLTITVTPPEGGTVTPASGLSHIVAVGVPTDIAAVPKDGYSFVGWTVTSSPSSAVTFAKDSTTVTLTADATITANFAQYETFFDDRDGAVYRTMRIGSKTWMAENLNYKMDGSWCYDDVSNCEKYGRLYTWYAAMDGACPPSWRLPDDSDWNNLESAARASEGDEGVGTKLKSMSPEWNGTDELGFTALPGGRRTSNENFIEMGEHGYWWSAVEHVSNPDWAVNRSMHMVNDGLQIGYMEPKVSGSSIRCVQD